jgi:hypothetical protein
MCQAHHVNFLSILSLSRQDTKSFDGWTLKKSILNTLLQAVKAIAGGVTSLSGQGIKASGYLVSQKGKVSFDIKAESSNLFEGNFD